MSLVLGALFLFAAVASAGPTSKPAAGQPASQPGDANWVPIGKDAFKDMKDRGFNADKMGGTMVFVDRTTGDVFLSMWNNGVWKSSDVGKTFARIDGGKISNAMGGPAGGRNVYMDLEGGKKIAIFNMGFPRVGPSGYTTDGGATWEVIGHADNVKDVESIEPGKFFKEHLRDWDFGAVDWDSMTMIGLAHETTKVFLSMDAGKTWAQLTSVFEGPEGVGILGPKTLLVAGYAGIQRSEDAGKTWTTVCRLGMRGSGPATRFKNAAWWLCQGKRVVIVSTDEGKTWSVRGAAVPGEGPLFGPLFGKDENHVVVACKSGVYESRDACKTWQLVTALPAGYGEAGAAFDPVHDVFYVTASNKPVIMHVRSADSGPAGH
jgi:photosystem II stability/assembly factor-like uncharacterized protein